MIWEIGTIIKHLLLPPLLWGWLLVYGFVRFRKKPRRARWAIGVAIVLLYASSTVWVANGLLDLVADTAPPLPGPAPQAVVILAGGRMLEYDAGGRIVAARMGPNTSERVIEGMRVARENKLPILVTSGAVDGVGPAEAVVMRDVMVREFGVTPRWVEDQSRNTVENALFTAPILKRERITSIILVTHASHMRRARYLFEQMGLRVVPQAADPQGVEPFTWGRFIRHGMPSAVSFGRTFSACNEIGGLAYAWLRMRVAASATPAAASATPAAAVAN